MVAYIQRWACDWLTEDADFGNKNHLFSWSSFWSWRVYKQANLSHLGHRNFHHAYIEKPTHPNRVTVWCWFWSRGRIGPFFFENEQWEAVTVNGDIYRAILNEFLFTKIEEEDIADIWFQKDGVASHTAEAHVISRTADVVASPRSCDFKPLTRFVGCRQR